MKCGHVLIETDEFIIVGKNRRIRFLCDKCKNEIYMRTNDRKNINYCRKVLFVGKPYIPKPPKPMWKIQLSNHKKGIRKSSKPKLQKLAMLKKFEDTVI